MKTPHFFKAKSRIGLTHAPVRQTELNLGVEEGANAILSQKFLSELPEKIVSEFSFSDPEDIKPDEYIKILVKELTEFKSFINTNLGDKELQFVIGGENSVTFSSLLALIERVEDFSKIGFIQFDSHGESNSFAGSDSHNFHGMYMRPFFDKFDISEIDQLIPNKLNSEQAIFIGDMVLDGDEPEFFKEKQFKTLKFQEYLDNKKEFQDFLKSFLTKYDYVHINFDIDVFHRSVAGATGISEDGKWMKEEIFELLEIIKNHPNISFDLSEINPRKEGAERTISLSQEIIKLIITSFLPD